MFCLLLKNKTKTLTHTYKDQTEIKTKILTPVSSFLVIWSYGLYNKKVERKQFKIFH